jgi:hypothetical protein
LSMLPLFYQIKHIEVILLYSTSYDLHLQRVAVVDWEGLTTDVYARQFFEISIVLSCVYCENVVVGTVVADPIVK